MMKKRILSFVMLLAMLLGTVSVIPVGAASADEGLLKTTSMGWDGTTAEEPKTLSDEDLAAKIAAIDADAKLNATQKAAEKALLKKGAKNNPYQISKAAHLKWLSDMAGKSGVHELNCVGFDGKTQSVPENTGTLDMMETLDYIYCKQTASIDLNGRELKPIGAYLNLAPSMSHAQFFYGEYDGQGYTISNGRFVAQGSTNTNLNWVSGMFGVLWGATVKNLTFDNVRSEGFSNVGILAGVAYADYSTDVDLDWDGLVDYKNHIRNITVKDNCVIKSKDDTVSDVKGSAWGGIVGLALNTNMEYCTSAAQMIVTDNIDAVGGIVGKMGHDSKLLSSKHAGTITYPNAMTLTRETHIGGVVGDWRSFCADEANGNFEFGGTDKAIELCINEGTFTGSLSGATVCFGGVLGATANLLNGVFPHSFQYNYNLSDETTWSHAGITSTKRVGGVAGCFFASDSVYYAGVEVKNCYTVPYAAVNPDPTNYLAGTVIGTIRTHAELSAATEKDCGIKSLDELKKTALYQELNSVKLVSSDFGWNGSTAIAPQGSGTKDDPYLISSAENLKWMQRFINSGAQHFETFGFNHEEWIPKYTAVNTDKPVGEGRDDLEIEGKKTVNYSDFANAPQVYFKQTCDIDLNGKSITSIAAYIVAEGATNGTAACKGQWFGGYYDGQGYSIKNGTIKGSGTNDNWNGGLFGTAWGATIENIVFDNVHSVNNSSATASMVVGKVLSHTDFDPSGESKEIFGARDTVIRNITVKSNCTVRLSGCSNEVKLYAGGIVGRANANTTIRNCINKADIIADAQALGVGGIVGLLFSNSTVDSCINAGNLYYTAAYRTSTAGVTTHSVLMAQTAFGGIVGVWGLDAAKIYGDMAVTNCINKGTMATSPVTAGELMSYGGIVGLTSAFATTNGATYRLENCINVGADPSAHIKATATAGVNSAGAIVGRAFNYYNAEAASNYEWQQLVVTNCYSAPFQGLVYTGNVSNALIASTSKGNPGMENKTIACAVKDSASKVMDSVDETIGLPLYVNIEFAVQGFEHEFLGAQTKLIDGAYAIRLISGIDSLNYKNLSYDVVLTMGDKQGTKTYTTKNVYTGYVENGFGGTRTRYASEFGYSYVSLFTIGGMAKDATYTVAYTPRVVYVDGTEGKGETVVLSVRNGKVDFVDMEAPASGQMLIDGVDISKYTILYKDGDAPTYYAADALRKYIRKATGHELPLKTSGTNATYEIRVGFSEKGNTTAKGTYSVIQTDVDLEILFSGVLAAEQVIDQMAKLYLNNRDYEVNLRTVGNALYVQENHYTKGDITAPKTVLAVYKKDTGDVRIMYQNVHGYTAGSDAYKNSGLNYNDLSSTQKTELNNALYDDVLEVYKGMLISYDPDIFCLQEANENANKIVDLLRSSGYSMYRGGTVNGQANVAFGLPIFYKTDRFTLRASGVTWDKTSSPINNTVTKTNYTSPWVVLEDKLNSNKRFAVFNSHFSADSRILGTDPVTKEEVHMHGPCTVLRDFLAKQLKTVVNEVMTQHGVNTVITGGDYNHKMNDPVVYKYSDYSKYENPNMDFKFLPEGTYDPYATMTTGTNALTNVRDLINPANVGWYTVSSHRYDFNTGMYALSSGGASNATDAIDNILCRLSGNQITLKRFQTCTDRITATSSDHPAQFVDFAWN